MTTKTTKRALLSSVLALFLCFSMLIGTTFAWFTDEVKSATNIIAAGNLDVELYNTIGVDDDYKVDGTTALFEEVALWEPGVVAYENLTVANAGTLALKYQLAVNITNAKGLKNLADVLKVAVVEGGIEDTVTRNDLMKLDNYKPFTSFMEAGELYPESGKDTKTYGVVIWWEPSDKDNDYNMNNGKTEADQLSIEIGVVLKATQMTAENDSFDNTYDEDAWAKGMQVYTADDLADALANGETNIVLMDDITLDAPIVIPAAPTTYSLRTNAVVLNLNGKTISNPNGYVVENYGNVVITGKGTLTGMGIIRSHGGSIVIEDGNFYASSRWQDGVYQHTLKAENSVVTINGGNFDATVNGQTNAMLNASENAVITINGGSFKNVAGELTAFDPYIFTYEKNGAVVINDGTFYGGWRFNGETATTDIYGGIFTVGFDGQSFHANSTHVVTVYGGTFTAGTKLAGKLENIVAAGYKAADNGDGTYTVLFPQESFDSLIDNAQAGATIEIPAGAYTFPASKLEAGMTLNCAPGTVFEGTSGLNINGATVIGATFSNPTGKVTNSTTVNGTFKNCTFEGKDALRYCYAGDTVVFEDCVFTATSVYAIHFDGISGKNVTFKNCKITGWVAIAGGANSLTFDGCEIYGNGTYGLIRTYSDATIKNCTFDVDNVNTTDVYQDGIHAVDCTVTVENCTNVNGKTEELFNISNDNGEIVYEGVTYVATAGQLAAVVAKGATDIYLLDGEYNVANCGGKTLTLTGSKNAVLKVMNEGEDGCDYGFGSSAGVGNITFNGLTIDTTSNTGNYKGYAYMKGTFNDCNFVGAYSLNNANDFVFNRCTFDFKNGYFWTWGAKSVTFDSCIFNGNSKTILAHGYASTVININNCEFNATEKGYTGAGDNTAAVEIDPAGTNTYTINFTGNNTKTDSYNGWTRVKDGSTGHTITGVN